MLDFRASSAAALLAIAGLAPVAAASAAAPPQPASESAALKRGRLLFLQCTACHDLVAAQAGGPAVASIDKVGPSLHGVIDRRAGGLAGFRYSAALRDSGLKWDEATLERWIEKPTALVPGTTMIYVGMPIAADRRALIAYLAAATRASGR